MTNIIELKEISKKINNKFLVQNINFKIQKGTITTLIGPNGAGKTTIAKIMLRLQNPSSGEVHIAPELKMGYVPQRSEFNTTLPLDVKGFLALMAPKAAQKELNNFAQFINLEELRGKDITEISGGQFQKLLIVATLLNRPDLIIFDEPTQFLDVASQKEFYNLIEMIRTRWNLTIFMISHDLFTVMKNSDQVICLNKHICCSGKPSDLRSDQLFLDTLSSLGFYSHYHDHTH